MASSTHWPASIVLRGISVEAKRTAALDASFVTGDVLLVERIRDRVDHLHRDTVVTGRTDLLQRVGEVTLHARLKQPAPCGRKHLYLPEVSGHGSPHIVDLDLEPPHAANGEVPGTTLGGAEATKRHLVAVLLLSPVRVGHQPDASEAVPQRHVRVVIGPLASQKLHRIVRQRNQGALVRECEVAAKRRAVNGDLHAGKGLDDAVQAGAQLEVVLRTRREHVPQHVEAQAPGACLRHVVQVELRRGPAERDIALDGRLLNEVLTSAAPAAAAVGVRRVVGERDVVGLEHRDAAKQLEPCVGVVSQRPQLLDGHHGQRARRVLVAHDGHVHRDRRRGSLVAVGNEQNEIVAAARLEERALYLVDASALDARSTEPDATEGTERSRLVLLARVEVAPAEIE
eukprot:scaffold65473_cov75-Phaeocystis_antarctica.AAC.2